MVEQIKNRKDTVDIGLVGKYVGLHDAYLSVAEALRHAGYAYNTHVRIHWIDSGRNYRGKYGGKAVGAGRYSCSRRIGSRGIEGDFCRKIARKNRPILWHLSGDADRCH